MSIDEPIKNNLLIKHTSAIHIKNNLSAVERKIANILLKNAYPNLTTKEKYTIQIRDIALALNWKPDGSYNQVKDSLRTLLKTTIEWNILDKDKKNIWTASNFISSTTIKGGTCSYSYSPELRSLFAAPNIYAKLNMFVQAKIGSKHSLALWEFFVEALCSTKKQIVDTDWINIEDIKEMLAVGDIKAYEEFKVLNRDIIKKSLEEINNVSDIEVSVNYKRENRRVVALSFKIKRKNLIENDNKIDQTLLFSMNLKDEDSPNETKVTIINNEETHVSTKLAEYGITKANIIKIMQQNTIDKLCTILNYIENKKEHIKSPKAYILSALKEDWTYSSKPISDIDNLSVSKIIDLTLEDDVWRKTLEHLIEHFGKEAYYSWFSHIQFEGLNSENQMLLSVKTDFIKNWIKNNYLNAIIQKASLVNNDICSAILKVK